MAIRMSLQLLSNRRGFALLEIVIALSVILLIIGGLLTSTYSRMKLARAERTIEELKGVAQAGVLYYFATDTIPTSLNEVVSAGYIHIGNNPYGGSYNLTGVAEKTITASTVVPIGAITHTLNTQISFTPSGATEILSFTRPMGYNLPMETYRKKWLYGE